MKNRCTSKRRFIIILRILKRNSTLISDNRLFLDIWQGYADCVLGSDLWNVRVRHVGAIKGFISIYIYLQSVHHSRPLISLFLHRSFLSENFHEHMRWYKLCSVACFAIFFFFLQKNRSYFVWRNIDSVLEKLMHAARSSNDIHV